MTNGYEMLANAVIEKAADDYTRALIQAKKWNDQVKGLEKFFTGKDFSLYTDLDGKMLMTMLQQEVKDYNYSLKAIQKSRTRQKGEA